MRKNVVTGPWRERAVARDQMIELLSDVMLDVARGDVVSLHVSATTTSGKAVRYRLASRSEGGMAPSG